MAETENPPQGEMPPKAETPPKKKSLMSSEAVIGWLQFGALAIGVAALLWSIFAYYVPPQQGSTTADGGVQSLSQSLAEDDFRNLQALYRAIDHVSIYDVNHANFEEGSRTLLSFMAARSVLLKRHELSGAFAEFSVAFEACRSMPTHENIIQLRRAAATFAEPLDNVLQRFARSTRGRPGT